LPSRLNEHAPQGLVFTRVEVLPAGQPKARVSSMHYRFPIIPSRRDQAAAAIASLLASSAVPVWREGRTAPIDLLASLSSLQLRDDTLCFTLRALQQAAAQPRDVLNALGLSDLEQHGCLLTRFQVEVTP
jgi:hypothetical protein